MAPLEPGFSSSRNSEPPPRAPCRNETLLFRPQYAPVACRPPVAMRIDILSLFPKITEAALEESMMKRAQAAGLVEFHSHNIRDWATDRHRTVDDAPYGGGQGMVMKCEPIFAAVAAVRTAATRVVLMSPSGQRLSHALARRYVVEQH